MKDGNIIIQYIIENEAQLREQQVLRKVSYQGGAYRQQPDSGKPVYAVMGIILAWTGKTDPIPHSLHNLLIQNGVPSEEITQTDDAKLSVYHMNNLSPEIRRQFRSDIGFLTDYLNEGNLEGRKNR